MLSVPLKPRGYFSCIEIQSQIISAKFVKQLRQAKILDMLRQSHQINNSANFQQFLDAKHFLNKYRRIPSHWTLEPLPNNLTPSHMFKKLSPLPHVPVKQPRTKQQASVIVLSEFN